MGGSVHSAGDAARWRPDFLVISPPKTGSSWLATNLRCHPQVFVPCIKEIKYFSSLFRHFDLNWYLDHFHTAGSRRKGEASPSYALLPIKRIRLIRRLLPDVKLIFLMRDPVARAWSHAKHMFRFREANFAASTAAFEGITSDQWRENVLHQWSLANHDYLGQLRRWLSVFPREQFYLGFFESIADDPRALLREVFAFLGVDADVDFSHFPIFEKVLPGLTGPLPTELGRFLRRLLRDRTQELVSFLGHHFRLPPPPTWQPSLDARVPGREAGPPACFWELNDECLARLLEQERWSEVARLVQENYNGYNIVLYRGRFYALLHARGVLHVPRMSEAELERHRLDGSCFVAPSLVEVKERVDRRVRAMRRGLLASSLATARRWAGAVLRRVRWLVNASSVSRVRA